MMATMLWTTAVRPMFTAILSFFPAQLENHTCSGTSPRWLSGHMRDRCARKSYTRAELLATAREVEICGLASMAKLK